MHGITQCILRQTLYSYAEDYERKIMTLVSGYYFVSKIIISVLTITLDCFTQNQTNAAGCSCWLFQFLTMLQNYHKPVFSSTNLSLND